MKLPGCGVMQFDESGATLAAEMEVRGIIPGTRLADVLTSALGNSHTALDISICSPQAGFDSTQTRHEAKRTTPDLEMEDPP